MKFLVFLLMLSFSFSSFSQDDNLTIVAVGEATLEKDPARGPNEALIEVYRRLRPGDDPRRAIGTPRDKLAPFDLGGRPAHRRTGVAGW